MSFVEYKEKRYEVVNDKLNLNRLGIVDIKDIKDLDKLTNLKVLLLSKNKIEEITGL